MKQFIYTLYNKVLQSGVFCVMLLCVGLTACIGEEYPTEDTPSDNFEALWQLMDEHYCFFEYKRQTIGVDWDEVHERYRAKLSDGMSEKQLFEVLCMMLAELKDGHVNLSAGFDLGRNWSYYEDFPENYDETVARSYLGVDYGIASGLKYKILEDNIGYVRCESFSDGIGEGNLSYMLDELALCDGLIIDVRNNGGGELTTAHRLAARFTNEKCLTGYICHKTGKGRDDFSSPKPEYIEPSDGVRWQKPVVVLTNRRCYSATNDFVKCMRTFPKVTLLGDSTGGGSGMPFTQEIPHGWSVRYSAVVCYDRNMRHTEFGIAPDTLVCLAEEDVLRKRDTLIEAARGLLREQAGSFPATMELNIIADRLY
ncbi:MAG: S41 family peptidase [Bacteroides sp.]|nr:S41 family peptidase [Roseburia sp.]MCM1347634.1 S41 family peptidase [Bacteroides sp.]MCM1422035.1 S41 family peptidase [Bacteroides sp.]